MEADADRAQASMGTNKDGEDDQEETGEARNIFGMLTELRYARLGPRDWYKELPQKDKPEDGKSDENNDELSLFIPGPGKAGIGKFPPSLWMDVRTAYAQRLLRTRPCPSHHKANRGMVPGTKKGDSLPKSGVPGANNWIPIGPATIRRGQPTGNPPVSGRALRIAIAPGGDRVYVATADGGVWRSDNGGASWVSTMDGFDLDPTAYASTSSACGAIAIDLADPDRVYVGTGEADTFSLWASRTVYALPTYHGVGPIRSDDGGQTWVVEVTDSGSTTLVGSAFFELAVDKADRENVLAATTVGLYRREPDGMGGYQWVQKRTGVHTSVASCGDGTSTSTFYAAEEAGGVFSSADGGDTWTVAGTGFPTSSDRVTLGARPSDPSVLYAQTESNSQFLGLYRLDGGAGPWQNISTLPALGGQADYNLALAVDVNDANTVYLGGSAYGNDGAIFRCAISSTGSGGTLVYSMTSTFIGTGVHADVHALLNAPGDSSTLWVCCDGGVWRTQTATGAATFVHRNSGLATLFGNFFSQHPTQPAVITLGFQDNGTARYTGEECWTHITDGDGGYTIINWANPDSVLSYADGVVYTATDGGQSTASFSQILSPQWKIMAEPLVGTPYNPGSPSDADTVAFGAGTLLFISTDFGSTWPTTVTLSQNIFALTFASPNRLYLGTTLGQVIRFDNSGGTWTQTQIDNATAGPLPVSGIITDIEVDPTDTTSLSVYVTLGGFGDQRHVWYFDGTQWQNRSGTGASGLLDVEHNAIVVDPMNPSTVYVGTDIGVWISTDAGSTWTPFGNGLPDAAVFALQIHPTSRLLRVSTGGRGMFELKLDPPIQADVELYVRDTSLDVGRVPTVDGLPDPETWPSQPVWHYQSRNIKVDVPTPAGYQTPTSNIDFVVFNDVIQDGSGQTATLDPSVGTVINRVYVEVHNRGVVEATSVNVMLLLANASAGLPPLPSNYETNVQNGTPISTALWQTVGIQTISNLSDTFPQVAAFNLPSTMLPPPSSLPGQSHYCVLALLHSSQDPFTDTQTDTDALTIADRKVALRNLHLVQFVGTPPQPQDGVWERLDLYRFWRDERSKEVMISGPSFIGRLIVLLPPDLEVTRVTGLKDCDREKFVDKWADTQTARLRNFIERGRFNYQACRQMILDIRRVGGGRILSVETKEGLACVLSGLCLDPGKRYPFFLYFEPAVLVAGQPRTVDVVVRDIETGRVEGGSTYNITLVKGDV
jgi:hypothetical protein